MHVRDAEIIVPKHAEVSEESNPITVTKISWHRACRGMLVVHGEPGGSHASTDYLCGTALRAVLTLVHFIMNKAYI